MKKTALLKQLREIKKSRVSESDIPEILNACNDFENTVGKWRLDDELYKIVSYDEVMEKIRRKAEQYDLWGVQRLAEGLPKCDYYLDNGDYYEELGQEDLEERLNNIIDVIKRLY